ncbi:MAG: 4'-phosphopantetheinyl transferase superfamily protein [Caldilineaceae bacterium]|nr:4'-phosphopantetheinyl transferase superfamily protein [Caldilineaceae bacterium]
MLRTGVDIIEISRVAAAINRYGDHFLARVYTPTELDQCNGRVESLAARFCAKEAAAKRLAPASGALASTGKISKSSAKREAARPP